MTRFRVTLFLICLAVIGFMCFVAWLGVRYDSEACFVALGQAGGAVYYVIKKLAEANK